MVAEKEYFTYNDIDGDGNSEMIITNSKDGYSSFGIYGKNGIIDQWNFRGELSFHFRKCLFLSGDSDNDGNKEFYAFTLSSDSVFLHCIHDLKNSGPVLTERLLSVSGHGNKAHDPFIIPAEMEDLDGDGIREIIPYGYATSNVTPDEAEYHDCSAHLMVLDRKLQFLFEPVGMGGRFSKITPAGSLHTKDTTLAFLYNSASSNELSKVYYTDRSGRLTDSINLHFYAIDFFKTSVRRKEMYLLKIPGRGLALLGDKLETKKIAGNETEFEIFQDDLDMDGRNEIMLYSIKT